MKAALNCHFDHISVVSWWCGKIGADHQQLKEQRQKNRKEGRPEIDSRRDDPERWNEEKEKNKDLLKSEWVEAEQRLFLSHYTFSEESKAFLVDSTSFDPSYCEDCNHNSASKDQKTSDQSTYFDSEPNLRSRTKLYNY